MQLDAAPLGHCGNAGCHATNADPGSLAVGFTCGSTKDSCWMGVQAPGSIVPNGGTQTPESTKLYIYIRKSPPDMSGTMPQNSDFALEADDLARLKTWIMAGAKND